MQKFRANPHVLTERLTRIAAGTQTANFLTALQ
jgi:hypothetical protein